MHNFFFLLRTVLGLCKLLFSYVLNDILQVQTVRRDFRYNLGFDGRKKGWTVGPCFGLRTHSWCMGSLRGGRVELAGHGEPCMACRFGCPALTGLLRSPGTHLRARNRGRALSDIL